MHGIRSRLLSNVKALFSIWVLSILRGVMLMCSMSTGRKDLIPLIGKAMPEMAKECISLWTSLILFEVDFALDNLSTHDNLLAHAQGMENYLIKNNVLNTAQRWLIGDTQRSYKASFRVVLGMVYTMIIVIGVGTFIHAVLLAGLISVRRIEK